jgi:glycosyltransferase involved in cell wall biosynthesis
MDKQTLIFQGPCFSRSGYGDHCRDLLKSLYTLDKYDIGIIPMRWGNTPQNQTDTTTEFGRWMINSVTTTITERPDIFIHVSVASEFEPRGHYNIGITAGVETNIIPKEFVEGSNKMDLVIVPSQFTKTTMERTLYQQKDKDGNIVNEFRVTTPIEVLFEGVDIDVFLNPPKTDILRGVETGFNFLIVGHWLKGELGQDRKDIGMAIKTFCTVFSQYKTSKPGLVLKISSAGFSVMDRESMREKIESITKPFGSDCPPIYLLHGDLTSSEMASLYHDDKIKAMISFTKGEGYGRPLSEFALTGKPIIVSKWSGLTDFLPDGNTVYLEGKLDNVHESASDKFLMKESKWFSVNYTMAANTLDEVYKKYDIYLKQSEGLRDNVSYRFSLPVMTDMFSRIIDTYVKPHAKMIPINLPKLNP